MLTQQIRTLLDRALELSAARIPGRTIEERYEPGPVQIAGALTNTARAIGVHAFRIVESVVVRGEVVVPASNNGAATATDQENSQKEYGRMKCQGHAHAGTENGWNGEVVSVLLLIGVKVY